MNIRICPLILLPLIVTGALEAGETLTAANLARPFISTTRSDSAEYFRLSLDARLRYEARNEQSFDYSHALTLRARPGIEFLPGRMISGYLESEHTVPLINDFRASNAALSPFRQNNTQIVDAENNEVNQAYLQLHHAGVKARLGRQRIKLDNLHFVGNAGWRQNEQTFEAVSLDYQKGGTFLYYAYANQLNRVFGAEAAGNQKKFEGDMHLFNASTLVGESKIGGYAYLLDFDSDAEFASSNTYGLQIDHHGLHVEYAYQTEAGDQDSYGAHYGHLTYTQEVGNVTYKVGVEYLEDGLVSPIAALHGPNGFADVFIAARRGIPGNDWDGLTDVYANVSTEVAGVHVHTAVHHFMDDSLSNSYGWEVDLVLTKKLSESLSVVASSAYFIGNDDEDNLFENDVIQNSIQLDYKF